MDYITFVVFLENNQRISVSTHYREDIESEVDAAWDYIYMQYPNAEYIEIL